MPDEADPTATCLAALEDRIARLESRAGDGRGFVGGVVPDPTSPAWYVSLANLTPADFVEGPLFYHPHFRPTARWDEARRAWQILNGMVEPGQYLLWFGRAT